MIDLNALTLYKEKIGSYLDDSMPLPSPKDVLILNDELIDNYTGNGITPHGSVKIDENNIASGFSNTNNYILTSLNFLSLSDVFEFQVKAKNLVDASGIFCVSTLDGDSNVCFYVSLNTINNYSSIGSWYNGREYWTRFYFGPIPENKMHYYRYKYLNNTVYFKLLDEDMNVLFEESKPVTLHLRNRKFLFGNCYDNDYQSPYISIDLSETWFKDKDGNLISDWNK